MCALQGIEGHAKAWDTQRFADDQGDQRKGFGVTALRQPARIDDRRVFRTSSRWCPNLTFGTTESVSAVRL